MRQPPLFLLLGFGLGVLLGLWLRLGRQLDPSGQRFVARQQLLGPQQVEQLPAVFVRCVVLVQRTNPKPHKFVRAVVDTYGRRCNRTLIFSGDEQLQRQFGGGCGPGERGGGWSEFRHNRSDQGLRRRGHEPVSGLSPDFERNLSRTFRAGGRLKIRFCEWAKRK